MLSALARKLTADPDFSAGAIALVDFRNATGDAGISASAVQKVADIFDASSHSFKVAFVADTDFIFGMSRMFEMLRDNSTEEACVFRNVDEAKRWLGLP